jgi:hypothetical protein
MRSQQRWARRRYHRRGSGRRGWAAMAPPVPRRTTSAYWRSRAAALGRSETTTAPARSHRREAGAREPLPRRARTIRWSILWSHHDCTRSGRPTQRFRRIPVQTGDRIPAADCDCAPRLSLKSVQPGAMKRFEFGPVLDQSRCPPPFSAPECRNGSGSCLCQRRICASKEPSHRGGFTRSGCVSR